jgi:uncharacterized membrane protein YgdD (TMEM256/DUF423 family)
MIDGQEHARTATVRWLGVTGSVAGLVAVAAGAFGAHGLQGRLSPRMLEVFDVAVRYQLIHALALLAAAWAAERARDRWAAWSGRLFLAGILLFSGSLYGLSLADLRWLGPVTPVGGVAFLAGWVFLAAAFFRRSGT